MIKIKTFVFNPFMENTYVLHDEETKEAVIIDPGCYEKYEKDELVKYIEENGLQVNQLLNTHCHIDHVFGNKFVKDHFGVKLAIHKLDEPTLKSVTVYAPNYGFTNYEETGADIFLEEGDKVKFGNSEMDIIFVPGHAPGHIAFYNEEEKICIGGDVLFKASIGRTDLPGGDFETLINSIHQKMFALSDDTEVFCGHGPSTTIGEEKVSNPFCALAK